MRTLFLIIFVLGLFSISLQFYDGKNHNSKVAGWWGAQEKDRGPASILQELDPEFELYKAFFSPATFDKKVHFGLDVKLRTDMDDAYLKRKAQLALHDSFRLSFEKLNMDKSAGKDPSLIALFKDGIISSFVDNFIKTAGVLKLFNKSFQVDFNFTPSLQQEFDYSEELSSNQLIQWDQTGKLAKALTDEVSDLQSLIYARPITLSSSTYQYQGGQISLWFKVMDMHPRFSLPNPKKNAVKGFVRFRRYFIADRLMQELIRFSGQSVHVDKTEWNVFKGQKHFYVTVDIFKSFSLGDITPDLDRMEIHFGKLQPDNLYKNSFWGTLFTNNDGVIKTGDLRMSGSFLGLGSTPKKFNVKLDKLVYDFQKKQFVSKVISNATSIETTSFDGDLSDSEKAFFSEQFFKQSSREIIDALHLEELFSKLGVR